MDYFQSSTNPFYDRTCNNEIVKMQRLNMEHLKYLSNICILREISNNSPFKKVI